MGILDGSNGEDAEPKNMSEDSETIVVICNRSGTENGKYSFPYPWSLENALLNVVDCRLGATFAGSSSLFRLRQNAGHALLLENMSRGQEGVCVCTT